MFKTLCSTIAVIGLAASLTACNSPGDRAVGGAVIGGGSGALIGAALGGRQGALLGGGIGAASGAIIGANSRPAPVYVEERPVYVQRRPVYVEPAPVYRQSRCPYGVEEDRFGNLYCR